MFESHPSRREFLTMLGALGASALVAPEAVAQRTMPTRRIPSSGELLPVIGLGSSKPVSEIKSKGTTAIEAIVRTLIDNGGKVVDTWPRTASNDAAFGEALDKAALRDKLFLTTKVSAAGQAGLAQMEQSLRSYRRDTIDLAQVFSLVDVDTHWPTLKGWKSAGRARYIGVQLNYSITERRAEEKLLPLAQDRGIGVIVNRPFMNGDYFKRLADKPLPGWATEASIRDWAELSLKYILPHPAITCVLTETSNPTHMAANANAAFGAMPDESTRRRMAYSSIRSEKRQATWSSV